MMRIFEAPSIFAVSVAVAVSFASGHEAAAQTDRPPPEAPAAGATGEPEPAPAPPPDAPPADVAPPPPPPPPPVVVTPEVVAPPPAPPPLASKPPVSAKFAAELYGFVEFDSIYDSTSSFNEAAGNAAIARPMSSTSYASAHSRTTFSARNSRLGVRLKGPDSDLARSSAIIEMDFLGNQPTPVSEAALFGNATFRFRHAALKVETPAVDVLAGQYWELFGWQSYFHPNTVEIQGVPGQVYSRAVQLRLSHSWKTKAVNIDIAIAALRPPQRDSARPDAQGGVRLVVNDWTGVHTAGAAATAIDAGGVGVSGVYRHFRVAELSSSPVVAKSADAGGVSIDVLAPIIPIAGPSRANALTLTGSYVRGTGIADLFSGLTGGIGFPALPNPNMTSPAPTYSPNIDAGLVTFTDQGSLHKIDWQAFMVGVQYYLPPAGDLWLSANYSQMDSHNIALYAAGMTNKVFDKIQWADGNLFWSVNQAVRFGAEFAWFKQHYVDDVNAHNYRLQLSGFYIF